MIRISRMQEEIYTELNKINNLVAKNTNKSDFPVKISTCLPEVKIQQRETNYKSNEIFKEINKDCINNIKEMKSFTSLKNVNNIPDDIFDIICNKIISDITNIEQFQFTQFRDTLYDILIYNIDMFDCIWNVISHFIREKQLSKEDTSDIMIKTYQFFKQYNNNYRPIYHLESIMLYIINKLHHYELQEST